MAAPSNNLARAPSSRNDNADVRFQIGDTRLNSSGHTNPDGGPVAQTHSNIYTELPLDNPLRNLESIQEVLAWTADFIASHGDGALQRYRAPLKRAAMYLSDVEENASSIHPSVQEPAVQEPANDGTAIDDSNQLLLSSNQADDDKWRNQSRGTKTACLFIGLLSGACQGWNQSVISSTVGYMSADFGLQTSGGITHDSWLIGILVAIEPLAAGALGIFLADWLQHYFLGRRGAVVIAACLSTVAIIGLLFASTFAHVVGLRVIIGLSLGAKASIIPPLLAEVAAVKLRGRILALWQIGDAFGIFCGFLAWTIVEYMPLSALRISHGRFPTESSNTFKWKFLSALPLIVTVPLCLFPFIVIPESYEFLLKTGRYKQAIRAAVEYSNSIDQGVRRLLESHILMDDEANSLRANMSRRSGNFVANAHLKHCALEAPDPRRRRTFSQTLFDVFEISTKPMLKSRCNHYYHMREFGFKARLKAIVRVRRCRNALISAGLAMVVQAIGGINVFAFFPSSQIKGGIDPFYTVFYSLTFGGVNFVFSLLSLFLTDKRGRTTLILVGLPLMAITLAILAPLFKLSDGQDHSYESDDPITHSDPYMKSVGEARTVLLWLFMVAFTMIYSLTLGPAAFSLSAECWPASVREAGMSLCVLLNQLSLGLFLLFYPVITDKFGKNGYIVSFAIFAIIDAIAAFLCFWFCVDTKGRELNALRYNFEKDLKDHRQYRNTEVWPKFCRYQIREAPNIGRRLYLEIARLWKAEHASQDQASDRGYEIREFLEWWDQDGPGQRPQHQHARSNGSVTGTSSTAP